MRRPVKTLLFCLSVLGLVSCDRVTKDLARERLMNSGTLSYFHDVFRLEYAENTGAALGLGDGLPKTAGFWLLSILPLCAMALLFVYAIRKSKDISLPKMLILSAIFAGGMGNLLDRIFFDRHVTDFMNLGMSGLRTGIFNFADTYILFGAIGWLVVSRKPAS